MLSRQAQTTAGLDFVRTYPARDPRSNPVVAGNSRRRDGRPSQPEVDPPSDPEGLFFLAGFFVLLDNGRRIYPADIPRAPILGARSLSSWLGGRGASRRLGGLGALPERMQRTGEPAWLDPVRRVEVMPLLEHLEREVVEHP
jgi:hypothetical protein